MSSRVEQAGALFAQGYNCAQSAFAPFAAEAGIAPEQALSMAAPFGGGISRCDELCGAVSGALLALGLRGGDYRTDDPDVKARVYARGAALVERFRAAHGAVRCTALIGINLSTPEGREQLKAQEAAVRPRCQRFVEDAVRFVEEATE